MDVASVQSLLQPLLARIETLEHHNEELKERVKALEAAMHNERSYQKMTISCAGHLRDSRLSSKDSEIKRPGWNSKTKVEQSPIKGTESGSHEKVKTKPPIPKIFKSPGKNQQDPKPTSSEKKITGGTKFQQHNHPQTPEKQAPPPVPAENPKTVPRKQENFQDKLTPIEVFSNKFEQLVKHNNQIITSMKHTPDLAKPSNQGNLVQKVVSPKSEYNKNSPTTSPTSRSFISQNPDKQKQAKGEPVKM